MAQKAHRRRCVLDFRQAGRVARFPQYQEFRTEGLQRLELVLGGTGRRNPDRALAPAAPGQFRQRRERRLAAAVSLQQLRAQGPSFSPYFSDS